MTKETIVLLVSPHSEVKLNGDPTYGLERRISFIGRILSERYKIIIIEPNDVKFNGPNKIRFNSYSNIKMKNMRLGALFLDLNLSYILILRRLLKKICPSVVIVSAHFGIPVTWLITKIISKCNCKIIYNAHNFEAEYAKISLKDIKLPKFLKTAYYFYSIIIEKISVRISDYVFAVSEENKNSFINKYFCNPRKIHVINPGAEIPKLLTVPKNAYRKDKHEIFAVFHGSYSATHNKEAIDIIRTQISKKLRKYKKLKFIVAGKNLPKLIEQNFISAGFVKNLPEFLASCNIAIVPLDFGEGTKLKIFDYMAAGLPIVTTKKGAEGMGFVNEKHAIITERVDDNFIKAIEKLVKNPDLRKKLGDNALKLLEEKYHPNIVKDRIYTFFDNITN